MDRKLLEKVKTNLRAVVQSSAECILLHQAAYQYKTVMDEDLPYRKLGFSSVRELIENINDAVYIQRESTGEILLNVPDHTSSHIDDLIRSQKVTQPKTRSGYRPRKLLRKQVQSGLAPSQIPKLSNYNKEEQNSIDHSRNVKVAPNYNPQTQVNGRQMSSPLMQNIPPLMQNPVHVGQRYPMFHQTPNYQNNNNRDAAVLSEALKQRVGEVCKNFRNGATFPALQKAYDLKYGELLFPSTFGFPSWVDFIKAMPNVVYIEKVGTELKIFPGTKPVTLQYNEISSSSVNQFATPSSLLLDKVTNNNFGNDEYESKTEMSFSTVSGWNDSVRGEEKSNRWTDVQSSIAETDRIRSVTSRNESFGAQHLNPGQLFNQQRKEWHESRNPVSNSTKSKSRLNSDVKPGMKTTIYQHPDGLPMHELLKAYQRHTGQTRTLADFGYSHILELVNEFSDIMHVGEKAGNVDIIFPGPAGIRRQRETYIASPVPEKREQEKLNKMNVEHIHLIQEMLAVVCGNEEMLTIEEFVELYQEEYQRSFMLNGTNHSPVSIIERFPDYFVLQYFNVLKISATQKGKDLYQAMVDQDKNFKLKNARKKERVVGNIPADAVLTVGDNIAPYPLPEDFKIGNVYQIHISSAEDPKKFRFQFEDAQEALEKLHDEMNDFYNDDPTSQDYMGYIEVLQPGMPCVVFYDQCIMWNRGIISRISGGDVSAVLFDYGNSVTVPHGKIRLIKKEFLKSPGFCFQACMYGISPTFKGVWSTEAIKKFYDLAKDNSTLDAKFVTTERPYQLILYANENGRRESIADILIKYNHAKLSVPVNRESQNLPSRVESVDVSIHRPLLRASSICSSHDERFSETNSESSVISTKRSSDKATCLVLRCTIYGKQFRVVNLDKSYYILAVEVSQTFHQMEIVELFLKLDINCLILRKSENYALFNKVKRDCGIADDSDIRLVEVSKVNGVFKSVLKYYAEFAAQFKEFVDCVT